MIPPSSRRCLLSAMILKFYGYRRAGAALGQEGLVINHKKIRRLMRQHDLHPKIQHRFVATADSNHGGPPAPTSSRFPTSLYVALPIRLITPLDAWSRLIVGYAVSRSIGARLTVAASKKAIEPQRPPSGCIHHSGRGSQYAAQVNWDALAGGDLVGSMAAGGIPMTMPRPKTS